MRLYQSESATSISLLFTILSIFIISCNHSDINLDELTQVLIKVGQYEYGQSLEPMVHLDDLIRSTRDERSIAKIEEMMLQRLKSECTYDGRDQICRRLRHIGSTEALPILANMLNDSSTFELSLYALEMIPGSEIDEVLYNEFNTRNGLHKIRLLNAIGIRSIEKAIPDLERILYTPDQDLAAAAVSALNNMQPGQSMPVLIPAMDKTDGEIQSRILNAVIQAAAKTEDKRQSKMVLLKIIESEYPVPARFTALQHVIMLDPQAGSTIILQILSSTDHPLRHSSFGLIHMIPEGDAMNWIISNTSQYDSREILLLIHALSRKTTGNYTSFFLDCFKSKDESVRLAGLSALKYSKTASVVPDLVSVASSSNGIVNATARESLYLLNAPGTDNKIMELLTDVQGREKLELIRCIGQRQIDGSLPQLISLSHEKDNRVSRGAVKAMRYVAKIEDADTLVELMLHVDDAIQQKDLTTILQNLVVQIDPVEQRAIEIINRIDNITHKRQKRHLFQVLGTSGNPAALPTLTSAINGSDPQLVKSGITALSLWPDEAPADVLLQKTKNAKSETNRTMAYRGYLTLLSKNKNISDKDLILRYEEVMKIAPNTTEQKKVFSGIALVEDFSAIQLASRYLGDKYLTSEAEVAIMQVAWKIYKDAASEKLRKIVKTVRDQTDNDDVRKSALELLGNLN